ncbi:MAG: STAS domain-containing protein [Gaiellales bacterium]
MPEETSAGDVTINRHDGVWVVALTGEHDLSTVEELRQTFDSVLRPDAAAMPRPPLVAIDLSQVGFLDSSVIGAIVRAHAMTEHDSGTRLAVIVGSPESFAARVFRIVGVTDVLPLHSTIGDALVSLDGSSDGRRGP